MTGPSRRMVGVLPALTVAAAVLSGAAHGAAQESTTLRVEENLRAEPQGVILGRLAAGTELPVVQRQGAWVEVEVRGWVWTRSLQASDRGGFDLSVSVEGGENLRAEPAGDILGRLVRGTLLERVESTPGWTRVRRVAWIWGNSLEGESPPPTTPAPGRPSAPAARASAPAGAAGAPAERWWRAGSLGAPILTGPDGDTLARAVAGSELQLLAREGNWVRVRVEGWSWSPETEVPDSVDTGPAVGATPEQVAADPEAFRGRVVTWEVRFVSLERAEKVRTDFYEGEPFLLVRTPPPGNAFVYVAVPPERLGEVEGLIPLERIRVVGRVRTGSAALTGNPILDLLELTRLSGG